MNISAYMPPEVKSSLRLVQAKRGGKVSDLFALSLGFQAVALVLKLDTIPNIAR